MKKLTTLQAAWDFIDQCHEEITIRKNLFYNQHGELIAKYKPSKPLQS